MRISDWSSRVLFRSKRAAIDNHLGALELTHQFRRIGQEQAAKQRTCHRVQATDHDHGEETERNRQCEGVGAELTDEMTIERAGYTGHEGAEYKGSDEMNGPAGARALGCDRKDRKSDVEGK